MKHCILSVFGILAVTHGSGAVVQPDKTYSVSVEAETLTSVSQTDSLVREAQEQFWQLFPPNEDWLYIHSEKIVRPVVWSSGWPNELKKKMYAEMRSVNGNPYPVYTIWAEADRITGDLTYYNMFGQPVWTSSAPSGYSPLTPVLEKYGAESRDELTPQQKMFNASSIGLEITMLPESFVASYEQDVAMEASAPMAMSMSAPPPPDGTSTNGGGGTGTYAYEYAEMDYGDELYMIPNLGGYGDGWIDLTNTVAGQEYEFYFTYNIQYIPFTTNGNVSYTAWLVKTGVADVGGSARWNAPMVGENGQNRPQGYFRAYSSEDSDGDGLSDVYELMMTRTDPYDYANPDGDDDPDADGLSNFEEYMAYAYGVHTDPEEADSDNDGKNDGVDPWPMDGAGAVDTDRDRMPDDLYGNPPRTSTSYPMLVADPDDDNDRFSDTDEAVMGTDPTDASSPGAAVFEDSDADGLFDWEEVKYGTGINDPDSDGDGVPDGYEVHELQTDPNNPSDASSGDFPVGAGDDSDGDGRPSWLESKNWTNPDDGLDFAVNIF